MSDASPPTNHDIGFDVSPGTTYPSTFSTPLEFANPDGMLSGTLRGTQFVGSNTLQIDSTQNLITIKNSSAALNQTGVLRVGSVSQNYLGMAVNNGTVDTMFAGQDSSGATVIKIAKAGFDAKTATNDQLIFNSAQNIFKVIASPTISVTVTAPGASSAFGQSSQAHGLTFTPSYIAFITVPTSLAALSPGGAANLANPAMTFGTVGGVIRLFSITVVSVDATNIVIVVQLDSSAPAGDYTFSAKVYLLQETFS